MNNMPQFLTIREVARTKILSEHSLRLMQKQGKIPHIMCGKKCLINYPLLVEMLTEESKKAMKPAIEYLKSKNGGGDNC